MCPPGALSGRRSPSASSGLGFLDQLCLTLSEVLASPFERGEWRWFSFPAETSLLVFLAASLRAWRGWPLLRVQAPAQASSSQRLLLRPPSTNQRASPAPSGLFLCLIFMTAPATVCDCLFLVSSFVVGSSPLC